MEDHRVQDVKRSLLEIDQIVRELDPTIREAAFNILSRFYFDLPAQQPPANRKLRSTPPAAGQSSIVDFFGQFDQGKPSENVHRIVAWLYSQFGVSPMTAADLREIATEVGITIPERPDATMRAAKRGGKSLYRREGKGHRPTVHGEAFLKETYGVQKGTRSRPEEGAQ